MAVGAQENGKYVDVRAPVTMGFRGGEKGVEGVPDLQFKDSSKISIDGNAGGYGAMVLIRC